MDVAAQEVATQTFGHVLERGNDEIYVVQRTNRGFQSMQNAVNLRSKSASDHPLLGLVPTQFLKCIGRTRRVLGGHEPLRSDRGCHVDELTVFAEAPPAGVCGFAVSEALPSEPAPEINSATEKKPVIAPRGNPF